MTKAVFMNVKKEGEIQRVYNAPRMQKILDTYEVYPEVLLPTELEKAKDFLAETELIFSTWGMPRINEEDIKKGSIRILNRKGKMEKYPIMSITVAMISNRYRRYTTTLEIGEEGASVKKKAKMIPGSTFLEDRRRN